MSEYREALQRIVIAVEATEESCLCIEAVRNQLRVAIDAAKALLARPEPEHPAIDLLKGMCDADSCEYPIDPGECPCCDQLNEDLPNNLGGVVCAYHAATEYLRKLTDGESVEPAAAENAREPHHVEIPADNYYINRYAKMADTPTPKAQQGTWTLTAPDGRHWQAESPLKCAAIEQRERVPADVALGRLYKGITDDLPSPPAATGE